MSAIQVCELPDTFSLDSRGRLVIGCRDCDYVEAVPHECTAECKAHPIISFPQPLRLLTSETHGCGGVSLSRWAVITKAEAADLREMKKRAEEMLRRHADPDIFTEAWHCARYILEGEQR